jgi:flap endonuclease-1
MDVMGIHNLSKVLKAHAPSSVTEIGLNKLENKIIAIDTSQTIYQYVLAIRSAGSDLKDAKGNITTHLHAILFKSLILIRHGCKLVYIFDGKPNKLKNKLLSKREKIKKEAKNRIHDSTKKNIKDHLKSFKITEEMVKECKHLLDLMGIPYIQAPEEADGQCAYMAKKKIVDYVQSDDMDLLSFGTPYLIKTVRRTSKTVTRYNLSKILEEMKIDMDQFIDLGILLGCDYCETIKGIGEKKVLSLIKKHDDIEGIIKWILKNDPKGITFSDEFENVFKEARKYFQKPIVIKEDDIELKWGKPDTLGILKYLEKKQFNANIISKRISEYWSYWCKYYCHADKKKEMLKKDLFPGIKFGPTYDLSFVSSDDESD